MRLSNSAHQLDWAIENLLALAPWQQAAAGGGLGNAPPQLP